MLVVVCGREDCEEYSRRYCRDRGEANQRGNVRGLLDDELLSHIDMSIKSTVARPAAQDTGTVVRHLLLLVSRECVR